MLALLRGSSSGIAFEIKLAPVGARSIIAAMSRLPRMVVSDRFFFISCRILPGRGILSASEFACLAQAIHERREEHKFLLTAWVFLPDHWTPFSIRPIR